MRSNDEKEHKYGKAFFEMNGNTILMLCTSRIMFLFVTQDYIDKKRYLPIIDQTGIRTRPLLEQGASIIAFIE